MSVSKLAVPCPGVDCFVSNTEWLLRGVPGAWSEAAFLLAWKSWDSAVSSSIGHMSLRGCDVSVAE